MRTILHRLLPEWLYQWLALQYQEARRLVIYPSTAQVGQAIDYDAYWDAKFAGRNGGLSPWRLARAQALASLIPPGSRVLDLGVGDGAMLNYLIVHGGVVGVGVDISPQAVAHCRGLGLDVRLADLNEPVTKIVEGAFDYVVLTEILEHLPDPEALLLELRPLARGGLLVSVPNTGYWTHRARLALGRFPLQWVVVPGEHLRFWTLADFRWWAGQLGFDLQRAIPYVGVRLLRRLWPSLFAAGFVYLLTDGGTAPPERPRNGSQ